MSSIDPRIRAAQAVVKLLEEHGYQVRNWVTEGTYGSSLITMDVTLAFDWTTTPSNGPKDEGK
jgi:hypothetical protein